MYDLDDDNEIFHEINHPADFSHNNYPKPTQQTKPTVANSQLQANPTINSQTNAARPG